MVAYERNQDRESAEIPKTKICVVGIGGGGLNVLDRICLDRMMDATLVAMHTDVRVLSHAIAPVKVQLGSDVMRGIGCGGDPELGREAATASRHAIRSAIEGHEIVFVCSGLGGGTGSGAAPVVAEIAKELGSLVFVFATTPFSFEGRRRLAQAEIALEELHSPADALILFENNRMGELVLPKEGIQKAFSQADQLIGHSVRAVATMLTQPGIVRVSMADLMSALRSPNARCLFGFGEARGSNRVGEALKRALKSPLVNQGLLLQNAQNLLVHVAGGESLALAEVDALMKQLGKHVPEQTQIMFGLAVDPKLGDLLSVTLISSLSAQEMALESSQRPAVQRPPTRPADPARPLVTPVPGQFDRHMVVTPPPSVSTNGSHATLRPVAPGGSLPAQPELPAMHAVAPSSAPVQPPVNHAVAAAAPAVVDLFEQEMQAPPSQPLVESPPPVAHATPAPAAPVVAEPAPPPAPAPSPPELFAGDHVPIAPARVEPLAVVEPPPAPVAVVEVPPPVVQEPRVVEPVEYEQRHVAPEPQPAAIKASIFSVIEDDDEEEVEETGVHWAQKYIQPKQEVHAPPVVEPRRDVIRPQLETVHAAAPTVKAPVEVRQPSLKLAQDDVARFKGTDKTIVDGDDLDVPTWMRRRAVAKG